MASRIGQARQAVRPAMKARLMLSGPAGAGKTHSALTIARELAGDQKILVVDTEEESALTYADSFAFTHLPWREPYSPRDLAETLTEAESSGYGVAIVDSMTHFWSGNGGILDIADGKFGGWKTARPAQRDLVRDILRARVHVILCVRSKMSYAQSETEDGNGRKKVKVEKVGMAPMQDNDLEYEMNVSAELDVAHRMSVSKTRCAPLADRVFDPHHETELADIYKKWLAGGEPIADLGTVSGLVKRMKSLPDHNRVQTMNGFIATFGRPEHLIEKRVADAEAFVTEAEKQEAPAVESTEQNEAAEPVEQEKETKE